MENRLELNNKPKLKLPKMTMFRVQPSTHNIEEEYKKWKPDVRICSYGAGSIGKILKDEFKSQEIWIISDNEELIEKINSFNWREYALNKKVGTPSLSQQSVKEEIAKWRID